MLVVPGDPRAALRAAADDADLLVIGSRGLGALDQLLIGSVAIALAHHPTVPTIVVPHPGHDVLSNRSTEIPVPVDDWIMSIGADRSDRSERETSREHRNGSRTDRAPGGHRPGSGGRRGRRCALLSRHRSSTIRARCGPSGAFESVQSVRSTSTVLRVLLVSDTRSNTSRSPGLRSRRWHECRSRRTCGVTSTVRPSTWPGRRCARCWTRTSLHTRRCGRTCSTSRVACGAMWRCSSAARSSSTLSAQSDPVDADTEVVVMQALSGG